MAGGWVVGVGGGVACSWWMSSIFTVMGSPAQEYRQCHGGCHPHPQ